MNYLSMHGEFARAIAAKLRPCPFCGSDWQVLRLYSRRQGMGDDYRVECVCGTLGPIAGSAKQSEAAWNARPTTPTHERPRST